MKFDSTINKSIEWFIPSAFLKDREMRTRARMFLLSHIFGPILGNVIPAYLFFIDPKASYILFILTFSICSFWIFPFLLKRFGAYEFLSYLSIQVLLFAILWGCYFYGGLSSPFLPWLVTVPLLAFFYLKANLRSVGVILAQIAVNLTIFIVLFVVRGRFPDRIPLADMQGIGVISMISASVYVSMMALYYARILDSQSEFEREVDRHLETADQLRAAAIQAERSRTAKAEFLAKMSHELRTPLNAVIGYSELLLEDTSADQDPQAVADLEKISRAGRHLLSLVNAILDLSKIEAGKMEVYRESLDIERFLRELADRWSTNPALRDRQIRLSIDDAIGEIFTDGAKLEQALDAAIANAVRYAPQSPVEVSCRVVNGDAGREAIEISVIDHGPGFPPALLPNVFETFSDRKDASSSKYGGAGLGLPLCHRLCKLIGATLEIRSVPEWGTKVTVTAPRHNFETEAPEPVSTAFAQAA